MGADQSGYRKRPMMGFSRTGGAQKLAKSKIGKGTTFSRATKAPPAIWASAPEGLGRRPAWVVFALLTISMGSSIIVHSQNTESTTFRTRSTPRGCAYMRTTIPTTSANVAVPREFARAPKAPGWSFDPLVESVPGDSLRAILAREELGIKPEWLLSADLRVTKNRPHQGEVLLCGLHRVSDSE
jgi:hypothetical protein